MPLSPGTRLGAYEILAPLGAGGMGEVYRARDTKLGREVAIKVLPQEFARDPERLARFEREARVLASLNHPNIAAIHGLEEAEGVRFLVLELVPGLTLAEMLPSGPLELDEALRLAAQIAEAVEAAHEKGIIHRDLKPANVKITPEGKVRVLDFGLAKAFLDEPEPDSRSSHSLTQSPAATRIGAILGTAAYMSPEQAKGKPVDRRTDIWAFGVVLAEMLNGTQFDSGDTVAETLAAAAKDEPSLDRLPAGTPAAIRKLLLRCLEKDSRRRLRDIGEARITIEDVLSGTAEQEAPSRVEASPRLYFPLLIAALLLAVLAALVLVHFRKSPPEPRVVKLSLLPPEKTTFGPIAVSPDGRRLAFVATDSAGKAQLWVRPLDSLNAQPLAGTEDGNSPFWSADSRFIAFLAGGKLKKIEASGGPPQTICSAENGSRGGAWNRDGVILFTPSSAAPLYRVRAAGGEPRPVTALDPARGESSHGWPQFLPDGRHFLFFAQAARPENAGIHAGSLDSTDRRRVLASSSRAHYGSGYLLFVRERTLMAQPFEAGRLQIVGEALPALEQAGVNASSYHSPFSVSENGVLVCDSGGSGAGTQFLWCDRAGKQLRLTPPSESGQRVTYTNVNLSPDGTRVAVDRLDPQTAARDIWLLDLASGAGSRFTFDPATEASPIWSPDGSRIVFFSTRDGLWNLYQKIATGAGDDEPVLKSSGNKVPIDWSSDGRFLLYWEWDPKTKWDLWVLPMQGDRKPIPILQTPFDETYAQFSPGGRWIAYVSNESGREEVYAQPFTPRSQVTGKWQISTNGGTVPRWRRDGKELFYLAPDGKLMAVDVTTGTRFQHGDPRPLFQTRAVGYSRYDVAADGQHFLIITQVEEPAAAPVTVVLNWTAGLRR